MKTNTPILVAFCVVLSATLVRAAYPDEVLADNPVAYWRLGEASGEIASDVTGQHPGTYVNGVVLGAPGALAGDTNSAATFSAAAQTKIEVPYTAALNPPAFTIECWARVTGNAGVYRSPLTSRHIAPGNATSGYIFYAGNNNRWQFWTGPGSGWQNMQGPTIVEGEWAHLVGTYDGTTKRFYVNGAEVGSVLTTVQLNQNSLLRIGGGASENEVGDLFFEGDIDDVAVYNSALSAERVAAHYQAGVTSSYLPVIHTQPEHTTGYIDQPVSLNVVASGMEPLRYQWVFNSSAIEHATNATHLIASAALGDTGTYSVWVSNTVGAVESDHVFLNILNVSVPSIEKQPESLTLYTGGTARFTVEGTGGANLEFQWSFGGSDLPGETNATLVIENVQPAANQGNYQVILRNEAGSTPSDVVTLTVLTPATDSYAALILEDAPAAYWRLGEQWGSLIARDFVSGFNGTYMNSVMLEQPGALVGDSDTAASFDGFQSKVEVPFTPQLNQPPFSVEVWAKVAGNEGAYRAAVSSRDDIPQRGYILYAGSNNRWQLWTGTGSAWDTLTGPPVVNNRWTHLAATYDGTTKRFYVDGVEVATSVAPFLPNAAQLLRIGGGINEQAFGGLFFYGDLDEVAFYGHALSADRVLARFAAGVGPDRPPEIFAQPASRVVLSGKTVELSVLATGSQPLEYQWEFEGETLAGQTNATLVVSHVTQTNAGAYRVTVRNGAGDVLSEEAVMTVIEDVPYSQAVLADNPVAYWRLGESGGQTVAVDQKGTHAGAYLNGVLLGKPGALSGDADTAAGFTATSKTKIEVPFSSALNPSVFSVECWARATGRDGVYRSALTSRNIATPGNLTSGYIFYAGNNNRWHFWTGLGTGSWNNMQGPNVVNGQWVHLVGTYDGTTKRFYVNGVQVASADVAFVPNASSLLRIGGGVSEQAVGDLFFEGDLDEVAVYDTVLTVERIQAHHAIGTQRPAAELPTLSIHRVAEGIVLTWSNGTLEEADSVTGDWTPLQDAVSPLTVSPLIGQKFYRVRQ